MNRFSTYTQPASPLCFEISSVSENAKKHIRHLHEFVAECDFALVSNIIMLQGDECFVQPQDMLEELKARCRKTILLENGSYASIAPVKILGFQCTLPNASIFTLCLALHPECESYSYQGFVNTIHSSVWRSSVPESVRSHRSVIQVLDYLKSLGLLNKVFDPTLFWDLRDVTHLRVAIKRSQESFCEGFTSH